MSSILLTGVGSSRSSGGGEGDPLAGIPYRLRFETHHGDKVLLPYFFQDVARTIPVTMEGDPVATMGPADAEFVPEQSTGASQAILFLAADGTPYLDLDGVDDWYPIGSEGGQVTYTVLLSSKGAVWNSFWSPVEESAPSGGDTGRWGIVQGSDTFWSVTTGPDAVRRNEVDLVSPFVCAPVDEWMVLTVTSATATSNTRGLFQTIQTNFGAAECIAFFIYDGTPTTEQRDTVEAFYETLKPAP